MRYRSVAVAVGLALAAAAGAAACYVRAARLRSDASWLLMRGNAQADQYASTFEGAYADQQLGTYAQRREVLERSHVWQRSQLLLTMCAVVLLICAYVLFLLARLRTQLMEGAVDLPGDALPEAPPGAPHSSAHLPRTSG
jgi:hypothetical protein